MHLYRPLNNRVCILHVLRPFIISRVYKIM